MNEKINNDDDDWLGSLLYSACLLLLLLLPTIEPCTAAGPSSRMIKCSVMSCDDMIRQLGDNMILVIQCTSPHNSRYSSIIPHLCNFFSSPSQRAQPQTPQGTSHAQPSIIAILAILAILALLALLAILILATLINQLSTTDSKLKLASSHLPHCSFP